MRPRWPLIVFLALLLLCPAALAQSGEISLLGYVTDESGLGISTVSVTVTSEDRSISKTAETDSNGRYEFTCLNDGKYSLRFEMEGFYTEVLPSVPYEYPQAVRIDRRLQIDKLHFRGQAPRLVVIVNNERGQALDDRFVEILDAEGKVIAGAFTSGCGRMSANVPEGELTVRVEIASLVEPFTQRVHYPGGRLTKTITVRHQD